MQIIKTEPWQWETSNLLLQFECADACSINLRSAWRRTFWRIEVMKMTKFSELANISAVLIGPHSWTILTNKFVLKSHLQRFYEDCGIHECFLIQDLFLAKNKIYEHSGALLRTFQCWHAGMVVLSFFVQFNKIRYYSDISVIFIHLFIYFQWICTIPVFPREREKKNGGVNPPHTHTHTIKTEQEKKKSQFQNSLIHFKNEDRQCTSFNSLFF